MVADICFTISSINVLTTGSAPSTLCSGASSLLIVLFTSLFMMVSSSCCFQSFALADAFLLGASGVVPFHWMMVQVGGLDLAFLVA